MEILNEITNDFKTVDSIKAIVLGGSSASNYNDSISDFDLYIYADCKVEIEIRKHIAKKYADKFEIDNQFFETGDEWISRDLNKTIDFMYRSPIWIEEQIERVWFNHQASIGYSTCFLYNVKNSIVLHDPQNWYKKMQEKISTEYPNELAENIIGKNLPLIYGKMSATFTEQILNAVKRNDLVSINHRISAFLASYFDVIFAINKQLHPGEKRLINFALDNCETLPENFKENIENLVVSAIEEKSIHLNKIVEDLKKIINV